MAKIILHPAHPDYCKECIYSTANGCTSKEYKENSYKVNCIWHYCKYKKIRRTEREEYRNEHATE